MATDDRLLRCPFCRDPYGLHVDAVAMAGRQREDGPVVTHRIERTGRITLNADAPVGRVGDGRRHRIALEGWCEGCRRHFALVLTQHKGSTLVDVVELDPLLEPEDVDEPDVAWVLA